MTTPARIVTLLLGIVLMAGCTPRGHVVMAPKAGTVGTIHPILVATTRYPSDATAEIFARDRSETLGFARFDVSVPPEREKGTVTFPRGTRADPATDFLTVSAGRLPDRAAFIAAVNAHLAGKDARSREAIVFVHGFNTNFPEGLYRQAQMRHDFQTPGLSVHYSWPSAANLMAYGQDRESALFARDGLDELLTLLARTDVSRILVVGHSMGALIVMDTMRQMAMRGAPEVFGKVGAILLMAPDLDIGVFRTQVRPLVAEDVPIYIFASSGDRALRWSSRLRGQPERLGSIRDLGGVSDLPIVVIDISNVEATADPLGHFKVATSPSMIALISGMGEVGIEMFRDEARQPNVFATTINVVHDMTEVVLLPLAE